MLTGFDNMDVLGDLIKSHLSRMVVREAKRASVIAGENRRQRKYLCSQDIWMKKRRQVGK